MYLSTIAELKKKVSTANGRYQIFVQIEQVLSKTTSTGKPYFEVHWRDATDTLKLRSWQDSPEFATIANMEAEQCFSLEADFSHNTFGYDAAHWELRPLDNNETSAFFTGDAAYREAREADFQWIVETTSALSDPRLATLCARFFEEHESRFRRTAAARHFHHARRGGLVEHVAQMMRTALALCDVYPTLNRDLLLTGILFHDSGKMWETCPGEQSFTMPFHLHGEMLGHISIGIELANHLWRKMQPETVAQWASLQPENEEVRLHLLHLIASHHGAYEFGSPVLPKTPEALLLHHIDNIDAKMEMMRQTYAQGQQLEEKIYERRPPLPTNLVAPLASFEREEKSNQVQS